ncbi:glutathione S-transferase family protein [Aestuariivita boseongensis]|uniref:glutathione S-transferase family protein n=1 Tax=Aestuariivita boseongensis TaxID=1470562 RepID=UPI0006816DA6|nr:glutathione binding-like protein [Aestuariivita boseongensis]
MITQYNWNTSNGYKIAIALEEMGLENHIHPINIGADEQFSDMFAQLTPNAKIPVITDEDGPDGAPVTMFESVAILIYLAEKTGKFWVSDARARLEGVQWLLWQASGLGPNFGQLHHFNNVAPDDQTYSRERFTTEVRRLYGVLNARLEGRDFMLGDYTIADMNIWPWVSRHAWQKVDLAEFPNVERWFNAIGARSAVIKARADLDAACAAAKG